MKILFIAKGDLPDFQCDTVMHGGRALFGENFIDANFAWYMYRTERDLYWKKRAPRNGDSYGRGFTLTGALPNINIDRTNIKERILAREFDCVIYGSCLRCMDYMDEVTSVYGKDEIAFIEGEDDQVVREKYLSFGHMFKRELVNRDYDNIHPICFGMPEEKMVTDIPKKTQDWGTVIPGQPDTYIFFEETPYYQDYQKSFFALTHKKGGWDCMRHYEILMNGCVPYFPDINNCPKLTMHTFPKDLCIEANKMIEGGVVNSVGYYILANKLLKYAREHLTTKSVINSILNKLRKI